MKRAGGARASRGAGRHHSPSMGAAAEAITQRPRLGAPSLLASLQLMLPPPRGEPGEPEEGL